MKLFRRLDHEGLHAAPCREQRLVVVRKRALPVARLIFVGVTRALSGTIELPELEVFVLAAVFGMAARIAL